MLTILSYQRSGNHLARYLVEFLTARYTLGCSKRDPPMFSRPKIKYLDHVFPDQCIGQKTHRSQWVPANTERLILVLRNPYEALLSNQALGYWEHGVADAGILVNNLRFFKTFPGPKLLLLYENLVYGNHVSEVIALAEFLDVPNGIRDELLRNWKQYWEDSLGGPKRAAGASLRSESFHQDRMGPAALVEFRDLVTPKLRHPLLEEHYGIPAG